MLEGEHASGPPKADRYFVQDQQRAVAVTGGAHYAVIIGWRNLHVGAADGLDDDGPDVLFLAEHVVEILGAPQIAGRAAAKAATARIAGRRMLGSGQERPDAFAKDGLPSDRDRVEGCAVKRIPQRERLVAAGGQAGELQGHADGKRSAGCKQDFPERFRRQGNQARGKLHRGGVGEPARREGQSVELALDGCHYPWMPVTDLVHVVAVKIHDPATLAIFEPDAFGGGEGIEAGGRERLVEEVFGVGVEERARPAMDVGGLEGAAQRRKIGVAFCSGIGRRLSARQGQARVVHVGMPTHGRGGMQVGRLTMAGNRSSRW